MEKRARDTKRWMNQPATCGSTLDFKPNGSSSTINNTMTYAHYTKYLMAAAAFVSAAAAAAAWIWL